MKILETITVFFLLCAIFYSNFILVNHTLWQNLYIFSNSDLLYLPSFFNDLREGIYDWRLWTLTPAPYFFPDLLVFFFVSLFGNNLFVSFYIYALFFSTALILSLSLIFRQTQENLSIQNIAKAVTLCMSLWIVIIANYPEDLALFILPSYHSGSVLISLILYYLLFRNSNKRKVGLFVFLSTFTLASDKQLIYNFFLPVFFSVVSMKKYRIEKKQVQCLIYFFLSFAMSVIILKLLEAFSIFKIPSIPIYSEIKKILLQGRLFENFKTAMPELLLFLSKLYLEKFEFFIFLIIGTGLNVYYALKSKKEALVHFSRFVLFVYFFSVLSQLFFGIWGGFRYVLGIYFFPYFSIFLYLGNSLVEMKLSQERSFINSKLNFIKNRIASRILLLGIIALCFLFILRLNISGPITINNPYPPFINCLDEIQIKYDLQYGIADYWNAKHIRYLSHSRLMVNQVFTNFEKYDWIHNQDWYLKNKNGQPIIYNFIVPERLDMNTILKKVGKPSAIEKCNGKEILIYKEGFNFARRGT